MPQTFTVSPGVTLLYHGDTRFKHGFFSLQFVRPMCAQEAALSALVPSVLLRGCESCPDLRSISHRLDLLYGAVVGSMSRRTGDYLGTGLYASFIEDRFALPGDKVLEPLLSFLGELLLQPVLENGVFSPDFVESEKRNLIAAIESQRNDKRVYAEAQMLRTMCRADSYGIPRLGEKEQVSAATAESVYAQYRRLLTHSQVELFYAGSCPAEALIAMLRPLFEKLSLQPMVLPPQTPFHDAGGSQLTETMEVAQGKLSMGFVTSITLRDPQFAALQAFNTVFGGGMVSKLFMNIREKQSLCYDISSSVYSSKGILTVNAGIDNDMEQPVREQVLRQLAACQQGQISEEELTAAKQAILSGLRCTKDAPASIESYTCSQRLGGLAMSPEEYARAVQALTLEDVIAAAKTVVPHTVYFLKGVSA